MTFMQAIRRNLAIVLRFSGREPLASFWLYVAGVMGFMTVAWAIPFFMMMGETVDRMRRFAAAHPEQATVTQGPGNYSIEIRGAHPELMPDFGSMLMVLAPIVLVTVTLLAAAVVRRLHDRGLRGAWGLMPLPLLGFGLYGFNRAMAGMAATGLPDRWFILLFLNNLIYLALVATLIVLLVHDGDPGANRFGDPVV